MAKSVPSDGSNNRAFEDFLNTFDDLSDAQVQKALKYFTEPKENGKPRYDDIHLPNLARGYTKLNDRYQKVPGPLKKYMHTRLGQGRQSWNDEECSDKETIGKFPWS